MRAWDQLGGTLYTQYVLGILQRSTNLLVLQNIPSRSRNDIKYVLDKYLPTGAIICTDEWASYRYLAAEGYTHYSCNHSRSDYAHEVETPNGPFLVTINHLESVFHEFKGLIKNHTQRQSALIIVHEKELMFRHGREDFWNLIYQPSTHVKLNPASIVPRQKQQKPRIKDCIDVII